MAPINPMTQNSNSQTDPLSKAAQDTTHFSPGMLAGTLRDHVQNKLIKSFAQPIIDVMNQQIMGHELLSRGNGPFIEPAFMFKTANALNQSWELDQLCLQTAFARISHMTEVERHQRFFVNVLAKHVVSGQFEALISRVTWSQLGIEPEQMVFELCDCSEIPDVELPKLEHSCTRLKRYGFQIAVDQFGTINKLMHLQMTRPDYIKLDAQLIENIGESEYQQMMLRSLANFASEVHATLIVEGVETLTTAEHLMKHNIRYMQGYLFGEPSNKLGHTGSKLSAELEQAARQYLMDTSDKASTIHNLAIYRRAIPVNTIRIKDLHEEFSLHPDMDHVVFTDQKRPIGLTTRNSLAQKLSGKYGFSVHERRPAHLSCQPNALIVQENTSIIALAQLATARPRTQLYDPVMVVNNKGHFVGTITMQQLLKRSTELEVENAQDANPLTGLPGNRLIEQWISDIMKTNQGAVLYIDLDRFKEYNDAFGFLRGDDCIRYCADTLKNAADKFDGNVKVGHVGGDDFIMVASHMPTNEQLQMICDDFDIHRERLFPPDILTKGIFEAKDRQGNLVNVRLTTVSVSVIPMCCLGDDAHHGHLSKASAQLKKKVKAVTITNGMSAYMVDRRNACD